jgi:hypothetical protein
MPIYTLPTDINSRLHHNIPTCKLTYPLNDSCGISIPGGHCLAIKKIEAVVYDTA